jgi:hypothetical protein
MLDSKKIRAETVKGSSGEMLRPHAWLRALARPASPWCGAGASARTVYITHLHGNDLNKERVRSPALVAGERAGRGL